MSPRLRRDPLLLLKYLPPNPPPPRKLTWQWKMQHLKMCFLLKIGIFQCHVGFQGFNHDFPPFQNKSVDTIHSIYSSSLLFRAWLIHSTNGTGIYLPTCTIKSQPNVGLHISWFLSFPQLKNPTQHHHPTTTPSPPKINPPTWMSQEVSKWLGSMGCNPNIPHL